MSTNNNKKKKNNAKAAIVPVRSLTAQEASFLRAVGKTSKKRSFNEHISGMLKASAKLQKKKRQRAAAAAAAASPRPVVRESYAQRVGYHVQRTAGPRPRDDDTISTNGGGGGGGGGSLEEEEQEDATAKMDYSRNNLLSVLEEEGAQFNTESATTTDLPNVEDAPLEEEESVVVEDGPIDPWMQKFAIYKSFLNQYGSKAQIQPATKYGGIELGKWIFQQRQTYLKGEMSPQRFTRLHKLNFDWHSSLHTNDTWKNDLATGAAAANNDDSASSGKTSILGWNHMYELLLTYRKEYNETSWPPSSFKQNTRGATAGGGGDYYYRGCRLGRWMDEQRKLYEIGAIEKGRKKKLDSIHFPWTQNDIDWYNMVDLLQQYNDNSHNTVTHLSASKRTSKISINVDSTDGTIRVTPHNDIEYKGMKLGRWVLDQFTSFQAETMPKHHIEFFQKIGYAGVLRNIALQQEKQKKQQRHNNNNLLENNKRHEDVLQNIRKKHQLPQQQHPPPLTKNNKTTSPPQKQQHHHHQQQQYQQKPSPKTTITTTTTQPKPPPKPPKQQQQQQSPVVVKAAAAPVVAKFDPNRWGEYFRHLLAYRDEYGTCFVPTDGRYRGIELGEWVTEQLQAVKDDTINPRHMKLLEGIGYNGTIRKLMSMKREKQLEELAQRQREKQRQEQELQQKIKLEVEEERRREHLARLEQKMKEKEMERQQQQRQQQQQQQEVDDDETEVEEEEEEYDVGVTTTTNDPWNRMYQFLLRYNNDDEQPHKFTSGGDRLPPSPGTIYKGEELGEWVANQLDKYQAGTLDLTRKRKLEDAGLRHAFRKIEVQSLAKEEDEDDEGQVMQSRKQEKEEEVEEEEAVVVVDPWDRMYNLLLGFRKDYGTALVPNGTVYKGMALGEWTSDQVEKFKRGELDPIYREKLESVGYTHVFKKLEVKRQTSVENIADDDDDDDEAQKDEIVAERGSSSGTEQEEEENEAVDHWYKMYNLLLEFREEYGTAIVPQKTIYKGVAIGEWTSIQVRKYECGGLDSEYRAKLEGVGYGKMFKRIDDRRSQRQLKGHEGHPDQQSLPPRAPEEAKPPAKVKQSKPLPRKSPSPKPQKRQPKELSQVIHIDDDSPPKPASTSRSSKENNAIKRQQAHWNKMFELLKEYKRQNGNCQVPFSYTSADGSTLGSWVRNQRVRRTNGALRPELEEKLDSIDFLWRVQAGPRKSPSANQIEGLDKKWNEMFDHLVEYKNTHGHCQILTAGSYKGQPLGEWVRTQRKKYKEGSLRQDRLEKLESIDFVWKVVYTGGEEAQPKKTKAGESDGTSPSDAAPAKSAIDDFNWKQNFETLRAFKRHHGGLEDIPPGSALGKWAKAQRRDYIESKLDEERIGLLEAVGFEWDSIDKDERTWKQHLQLLIDYKAEYGHTCVQTSAHYKGRKLGEWVAGQRKLLRENQLPASRVRRLDEVGMVWVVSGGLPRDRHWNAMFESLKRFKEENGTCMVRAKGSPLGEWVRTQRKKYKEGTMRRDRLDMLQDLGFVWKATSTGHPAKGMDSLQAAEDIPEDPTYSDDEVDSRQNVFRKPDPPTAGEESDDDDGPSPRTQDPPRKRPAKKAASRRSAQKRASTASAGPDREQSSDNHWGFLKMLQRLKQYRDSTGDCLVPKDAAFMGCKLGEWVLEQRTKWEQGKMTPDHKEMLDEVGFVWDVGMYSNVRNDAMMKMQFNGGGYGMGNSAMGQSMHMHMRGGMGMMPGMGGMGGMMPGMGGMGGMMPGMGGMGGMGGMAGMGGMGGGMGIASMGGGMGMNQMNAMKNILTEWLMTQFQKHMQGLLRHDHHAKLTNIGYDWGPAPTATLVATDTSVDVHWNKMFELLKEYNRESGRMIHLDGGF